MEKNTNRECMRLKSDDPFEFKPLQRYTCDNIENKPWAYADIIVPTTYNMALYREKTQDIQLAPGSWKQFAPNQGPAIHFGNNTNIKCINYE